jgi:hypothetical protein
MSRAFPDARETWRHFLIARRPRPARHPDAALAPPLTHPDMSPTDPLAALRRWRALTPTEKERLAWAAIPRSVAASMAFEGEPVDLARLESLHTRSALPPLHG